MKSPRIRRLSASFGFIVLLGIIFTLASATTARGQVVSNPRIAEFEPSPDHWLVLDSGQPAVARYELGVYTLGSSAPFATADMGKPSPDSIGKIRYDFSAQLTAWRLPGGEYEARVSAVGPEGSALSDPSNPFTFTNDEPPCSFSVNTTHVAASATGGTYQIDLSTGSGCEWAVTSAPSWVTLRAGVGVGSGTLVFEVQANPSSVSRTGLIEVAGLTVTVSQEAVAADCSYRVTPTAFSFAAAGGRGEVTVTTGSACGWSVASSQSWLIPSVSGGTDTATFSFTVKQNKGVTSRRATLTAGPWAVTVFQSGKTRQNK